MTTTNPYIDDLERMRGLLCNAASCIDLANALRSVAEAEAIERKLNRSTEARICTLAREAIIARHRWGAIAAAALPVLREAERKASEVVSMYEGKQGANPSRAIHLGGVSAGLSQAVEIVERVATLEARRG